MDRLMRVKQVASVLGIHPQTVYKYIREKKLPPPLHMGKRIVIWPESTISDWIENRKKGIPLPDSWD